MKICMFVKNSFEYDARVTRAAKKLIEQGHEVTVIALFSRGLHTHETTPDGIKVVRVYRYPFGGDLILKLLRDKPKVKQPTASTSTASPASSKQEADSSVAEPEVTTTTTTPTSDTESYSASTTAASDTDDASTQAERSSTEGLGQSNQPNPIITPTPATNTPQPEREEDHSLVYRVLRFGYRLLRLALRIGYRAYRLARRIVLRGYRTIRRRVRRAYFSARRGFRRAYFALRRNFLKVSRLPRKLIRLCWKGVRLIARRTRRTFWRGWRFFWWGVMKALRLQGRAIRTYAINRRMIREGLASGADIYHAHDVNTLWIATQCKKKTGIPLIYDTHEFATERNRMGWWWRKRETWNERRGLAHTDGLIVVTPDWIPRLKKLYGKIPPHWVTVTNVPETREINTRDLRGALGIHNGHKILVYQGSIQENRGIEPAIEAVKLLDNVVLVVIGYGYHRPRLEEIVEHQGLEDKVKFFGPIPHPQLLDWTSAGDIGMCNFVNSSVSYFTSIPNKLSEYMMAGLPVIGSDSPGIGSIIEEQGSGITVDPLSGHEIAEAVRAILADPEPYKEAARKAVERYNWDVESQNLLELYSKIIPLAKPVSSH